VNVTLRPEAADDEAFLRRLIVETVALELDAEAWPEPMRSHLLGIQCNARLHSRRVEYPGAVSHIVQADGADAGWAVVHTTQDEVRLVEIMVLPELRGKGIGAAVIAQICAVAGGKPVRLEVNLMNSGARRLYERLGFRVTGQDDVQYLMEKLP
jgi:ribosomal protein S18 acetylase RimI-like enzyme